MPNRTQTATAGLLVPATLALSMSADTSYRFMATALQISAQTERLVLCGVAEAAIVALTVYAWATRTKGPAYLAYAAVLVQAIPAFQVSGSVGGPVRVVLGPVLLAVLLHLLLGLELRMSGAKPTGLLASVLRELRERLTAFLGIGRRGADSAAIARSRAADRAVDLADRVEAAKPGTRKHTRLAARLAVQIDAARHGLSPDDADAAERAIVARVVRRKSVTALARIPSRHDWTVSLVPGDSVPVSPSQDVPRDVSPTVSRDEGQAAVSPVPLSPEPVVPVSPVPQDVPAPVSRPRAAVPAVSPARPLVSAQVSLDRDSEGTDARDSVPAAGDTQPVQEIFIEGARAGVPEDKLGNLSAIVRFLTATGHTKAEIREIVPTLPGHENVKPDSLKKAVQRYGPVES